MDSFQNHASTLDAPARSAAIATHDDTQDLPQFSRALYVGAGGDVTVQMVEGMQVTFSAVPGGTLLPIRVRRVLATGTTAAGVVALW